MFNIILKNSLFRKIQLKLPWIIPFGELKLTLGFKLYANALFALFGGLYFLENWKMLSRKYWFFVAFAIWSLILAFPMGQTILWGRIGYLFCLVGLAGIFERFFKDGQINSYLNIITVLCVLVLILEDLSGYKTADGKMLWGIFHSPQYFGVLGEPNFSSLIYFTIAAVALSLKRYLIVIFMFLFILGSASKGALISISVLLVGHFFPTRLKLWSSVILLFLVIIYPWVIKALYLYNQSDLPSLVSLEYKSSARFLIHNVYVDLALKHPLGVGYFQGQFYLHEVFVKYMPLAEVVYQKIEFLEQHNLVLQILSESGIVGYLVFLYYLSQVYLAAIRHKIVQIWPLSCFMLASVFLNCLSSSGLYLILSMVIAQLPDKKAAR